MTKIMDCYLAQETCGSRDIQTYEASPCGSELLIVYYDDDDLGIRGSIFEGSSVMDCVVCSAKSDDQKDFYEDILDNLSCAVCEEKVSITEGEFRDIAMYRDGYERFSCSECSKWKLIQDAENDELIDGDSFDKKLFFFYDGNFFEGKKFENGFLGSNMSFFRSESQAKEDAAIELECDNPELAEFVNNSEIGDVHYGSEYNSNIDVYRIR